MKQFYRTTPLSREEFEERCRNNYVIENEHNLRYAESWLKNDLNKLEHCNSFREEKKLRNSIQKWERMIQCACHNLEKENIEQHVRSMSYEYVKRMPIKDNCDGTVIHGTYAASNDKIRVPKLKRKNAWKKFYRRYPDLKGMDVISGWSSSSGCKLNKSTIKLKKV